MTDVAVIWTEDGKTQTKKKLGEGMSCSMVLETFACLQIITLCLQRAVSTVQEP